MPTRFAVFITVCVAILPGAHVPGLAGDTDPKPEDLVIVRKGTLPVIVSAPHGGRKEVPGVPERKGTGIDQFTTVRDENTDLIAEALAAELEKKLGGKPWVVVARFDRKFIDANRPPDQAYETDDAKPFYDAYHRPLAAACKAVKEKHGRGLLLDVHGQGEFQNAICRGTRNGKTVSLLVERYGWAAVVGKNSVMGRLERAGYKVIPAGDAPPDTKEELRFNGGYTVGTYGSHTGYGIDAIQLEIGSNFRSRETYAKTAKDLADAVAAFHDAYLKDEK
jgi:N-formylglutamate amidohydrolase